MSIPPTSKAEPASGESQVLGGDVSRLLSGLAGNQSQYRETGRQSATRFALARWPLLREIDEAATPG